MKFFSGNLLLILIGCVLYVAFVSCGVEEGTPTGTESAENSDPDPTPKPTPLGNVKVCNPYLVTVRVRDGISGNPLAGARVQRSTVQCSQAWYVGNTGGEGEFFLDDGIVGDGVWYYFRSSHGGAESGCVSYRMNADSCHDFVDLVIFP